MALDPHRQHRGKAQTEYVLVGHMIADVECAVTAAVLDQYGERIPLARRARRKQVNDTLAMH